MVPCCRLSPSFQKADTLTHHPGKAFVQKCMLQYILSLFLPVCLLVQNIGLSRAPPLNVDWRLARLVYAYAVCNTSV